MYDNQEPDSFDEDDIVAIDRQLDPKLVQELDHVAAFLLRTGGMTSHGVIIAREMGLTVVCGLEDGFDELTAGTKARVDGIEGIVELEVES